MPLWTAEMMLADCALVILISALASTFIENVSFAADLSVDYLGD
jgi:hypothetical protein